MRGKDQEWVINDGLSSPISFSTRFSKGLVTSSFVQRHSRLGNPTIEWNALMIDAF